MEEFDDWRLDVPFHEGDVTIVCCPEDRRCNESCLAQKRLCQHCEVPICRVCNKHASGPNEKLFQSPVALSNDLMVFYAAETMFKDG
eukprot:850968-Karenia_brevis.AAC.1